MDMSQYLEIFIDESKEHLQEMNETLLKLEEDFSDTERLNDIFRVAHTIKGMSGTMGFNKVASLTHEMENVLHIVRSGELEVDETIIDILFECFDGLEEYIEHLSKSGQEGELDTSDLVSRLNIIAKNKSTTAVSDSSSNTQSQSEEHIEEIGDGFTMDFSELSSEILDAAKNTGLVPILIKVELSKDCALKAARVYLAMNTLEQYGEIMKSNPSVEELEEEKFGTSFEILYLSRLDTNMVKEELMHISELENVITKELQTEDFEIKEEDKNKNQSTSKKTEPAKKQEEKTKSKAGKMVRVDIDRLDNLMNLVSELIIVKTRLDDFDTMESRQNMSEAVEYLERITTSLHDAVMKVRMVPVERTFNRFPRLVRDLSKDLGKNIKLIMTGEDTEVDRTVIDEIGDPLIHLIRNSIDHGIESIEDRKKRGKNEEGVVHLMAYPDGNSVVIEVKDDGNGIDPEKISKKAFDKNLISYEQLETMSDTEIVNMLFLPGFSMSKEITDISGRGVGLDVVKSKIEALSGTVEIDSKLGVGSTFIIRLPLTLAIIQALMVELGDEKFAIPLNNIKIITTIKPEDISKVQNQEVVLYRDQTLPIVRLADKLQVPNHSYNEESLTVVIVRKGNLEAGLVVDSLIGQQEIVIKSLGKYLGTVNAIAGATILGNGGVALIVDPNQLL